MVAVAAAGEALLKEATSADTLAHAPALDGADPVPVTVVLDAVAIGIVALPVAGAVTVPLPVGKEAPVESGGNG